LIVCDDRGGSEPVEELLRSYQDSRIQYVLNEKNLGMVGNWNKCLELSGEYVTLLHADDQLEPSYVSTILTAISTHSDAAAWCCRTRIIGAQGEPVFSFPDFWKRIIEPSTKFPYSVLQGEKALARILGGNFIFCPTLCYNRRVLTGDLFNARWRQVQDLDLMYRVLLADQSIVVSNTIGYAYRRHEENATSLQTASLLRFEEESSIYDETKEICEKIGWHRAAQVARRKRIIKLSLLYFALKDLFNGRLARCRQKIGHLSRLSHSPVGL